MSSKTSDHLFRLLIPAEHKAKTLFHDEKLAELYGGAVRHLEDVHVPDLIADNEFDPAQWSTAEDQFLWVRKWMEESINFEHQQMMATLGGVRESFRTKKGSGGTGRERITPLLKAMVKRMHRRGSSAEEIAKEWEISVPFVCHMKMQLGLVRKRMA